MGDDARLLGVVDVTAQQDLPAGRFSSWLRRTRNAQQTDKGADVPCGECNACCRSSYFIHVEPEETETLARIPEKLLFPAPGLPEGNVVLGYDEKGHCPMLVDDVCSIYEHRPQTCRKYECRVFPAAGIVMNESGKAPIAEHTPRWKFSYPTERDRALHSAVRAAATFLEEHAECFNGAVPSNATQLAVLAIRIHDVFFKYDFAGRVPPLPEIVAAVKEAMQKFESAQAN